MPIHTPTLRSMTSSDATPPCLSQSEGILDIDAEAADSALDLRMAEQNLHGT